MSLKKYSLLLLAFTALGIDSVYCADMYRTEIDKLNAKRRAILARSGGEDHIYERATERDLDRFLKIEFQLSEAQNSLKSVQASHAGKGGAASAAPAPRSGGAYGSTATAAAAPNFMIPVLLEERQKFLSGRSPEELLDSEVAAYAGIMADLYSHGYVEHGAAAHGAAVAYAVPAVPAAARATAAPVSVGKHDLTHLGMLLEARRSLLSGRHPENLALREIPLYVGIMQKLGAAVHAAGVAEFNVYDAVKVKMLAAAYMSILSATEHDHIREFEAAPTIVAKEGLTSVQLLLAETRRQGSAVTTTEIVGFLQSIMQWN